jgi:hypothetical protein
MGVLWYQGSQHTYKLDIRLAFVQLLLQWKKQ